MKKRLLLSYFLLIISYSLFAQNVGIGTTTPHSSAALEINNNSKGVLIPTMTAAQRNLITSPAKGLMVYDTTNNAHYFYNGNTWKPIGSSQFKTDSSLNIGNQIRPVSNFILGTNSTTTDTAGYLYDNGGPAGNYGNNRNDNFSISQSGALGIILELQEMDTEDPYDSLKITVGGISATYWGTQTDTLIFDDLTSNVTINFKSNSVNTQPGFKLYWKKILIGSNPVTGYDASQKSGWYYNEVKQYMRGGINKFNNWHPDSSGIYSFSFGDNTKAKGSGSFSAGINTSALGSGSVAMGYNSAASGSYSITFGPFANATSSYAIAFGYNSNATNTNAIALGVQANSTGLSSIALGNYSTASGNSSLALGFGKARGLTSTAIGVTTANGDFSTALGYGTNAKTYMGTVVGVYNDTTNAGSATSYLSTNPVFQIGNGRQTGVSAKTSNAMTVLNNGNIGIGENFPATHLHISGSGATNQFIFEDTTNAKIIKLSNDGSGSGPYIGTSTNHPFSIVTNNAVMAVFSNTGNVGIGDANPDVNLVVKKDIRIDAENSNNGDRTNSLRFGSSNTGEFIISKRTAGGNQYGLDFFTNGSDRLSITNTGTLTIKNDLITEGGKVGFGESTPLSHVHISGSGGTNQIRLEDTVNNKSIFISNDGGSSGPYIGTSTNHPFSLVSNNAVRAIVTNTGTIDVKNNLTVQNGKGIIRNADGTQSKKLSTLVTVNATFLAGESKVFTINWPETFSSTPEAFVGNVTGGAGGWAEAVMTISGVSTTGGTLYVFNPKTISVSPNFTVKIIGIGPQ